MQSEAQTGEQDIGGDKVDMKVVTGSFRDRTHAAGHDTAHITITLFVIILSLDGKQFLLLMASLNNSVALVHKRLYRPSDHSLSAKLVPTFADRGCHVVSTTDPHGH
jgi:hypothetical protein